MPKPPRIVVLGVALQLKETRGMGAYAWKLLKTWCWFAVINWLYGVVVGAPAVAP